MRKCSKCKEEKPLEDFKKDSRANKGRGYVCTLCSREVARIYASNWTETQKEAARVRRQKMVRASQLFICEYLQTQSCVDCGEDDIELLDFDHLDPITKHKDICRLVREASLRRIKEEITKCEVVCCSCHRKRTNRRGNNYRFRFAIGTLEPI